MEFTVQVAEEKHQEYALEICRQIEESAKARGTGIAKRDPEYIKQKIREGKAVIALSDAGGFAGFCYIETWSHGNYVANSGLIVNPEFRKAGLAKKIKEVAFALSRERYPNAKLFGLTTSLPVMKINSEIGYEPVTYSELTNDDQFWSGCKSCINYEILMSKNRTNCLCTAMLYDPEWEKKKEAQAPAQEVQEAEPPKKEFSLREKLYERWMRIKANILLREKDKEKEKEKAPVMNQARPRIRIVAKVPAK
jgi:hypothetical protein